MSYEFWVWDVESVVWLVFNLVFVCYNVSIILGYWFLGLIWVFEVFSAVFVVLKSGFLGFLRCWPRSCSWWSRSAWRFRGWRRSGFGLIAIRNGLDRDPSVKISSLTSSWSRSISDLDRDPSVLFSFLTWGLIAIRCCSLGRFSLWAFKWDLSCWTVWIGFNSWLWRS